MVCLYCGKKLTMVKKLTAEDFCSLAHRRAYQEEQDKLAVARLQEEQAKMKPGAKPKKANLEEIATASAKGKLKKKGSTAEGGPEFAEYLSQQVNTRPATRNLWATDPQLAISLRPIEPAASFTAKRAQSLLADAGGPDDFIEAREIGGESGARASVESAMRALSLAQEALPPSLAVQSPDTLYVHALPNVELHESIGLMLDPIPPQAENPRGYAAAEVDSAVQFPSSCLLPIGAIDTEMVNFEAMGLSLATDLCAIFAGCAPLPVVALEICGAKRFAFSRLPEPCTKWQAGAETLALADLTNAEFDTQPVSMPPVYLSGDPDFRSLKHAFPQNRVQAPQSEVAENPEAVRIPVLAKSIVVELQNKEPQAMLPELSMAILAYPETQSSTHRADEQVVKPSRLAAPKPRVIVAPKVRIPRRPKLMPVSEFPAPVDTLEFKAPAARGLLFGLALSEIAQRFIALPANFVKATQPAVPGADRVAPFSPKARVAVVRRSGSTPESRFAVQTKLFEISFKMSPAEAAEPKPRDPLVMRTTKPMRPHSNLNVIPTQHASNPFSALSQLSGGRLDLSWTGLKKQWHSAPNDLRWIACAVPLVIGLIWFSTTPGVKDDAKGRLDSMTPNTSGFLNRLLPQDDFEGLKVNIQRRAAVELSDDFRQGLGEWSGSGDWAQGWRYDSAGFIRPRQIALYSPSLVLGDYRFEFLGQIEKKALSWVFRAADLKNYYVSRLEVVEGGPLPHVELVRYAVIDGKPGPKKSTRLPMQVYQDTIYRVRMDVQGNDFVTTVQGQVVDVFSDDRLPRGGVGFYCGPGEDVRLRWVEVSHQYDFLGRLCAFLVPYNVSNSNERSAP